MRRWAIGLAMMLCAAPSLGVDRIPVSADAQARFTVPVFIDGQGPFQFLVDSAATTSVISSQLAGVLGLRRAGQVGLLGVDGRTQVRRVQVGQLKVGQRVVYGLELPVLDAEGVGAEGILGADAFQGQRVSMDLRTRQLTIGGLDRSGTRGLAADRVQVDRRYLQMFITDADIDGHPLTVVVDSGSSSSVINEAMQKLLSGRVGPRAAPATLIGVTGGEVAATVVRLQSVRIGNFLFTDAPASAADLRIFRELGLAHKPAMLLGMNLLAMFDRVDLDFARKRVSFFARRDASDMALAARFAGLDRPRLEPIAPRMMPVPAAPAPTPAAR